jgi:outer membrane assembly lipoprotein YfiO
LQALLKDRHNSVINTRKRAILAAFLIILSSNNSLLICTPSTPETQKQAIDLTLPSHESKTYKKRMRQKSEKTKKEKKPQTYKEMSYQELAEAKDVQKSKGNITAAIKYLDQMMKLCSDITKLAEHLLEVADLFFQSGQYEKSARLYTEYSSLYPGSEQQEYALYRAIASSFACILSTDRDQTKTEETVALTEIFLIQDHFVTHRDKVKEIQLQCYEKLALSECNVCFFYLTRDKFNSAERRLKKLRSTWLPKLPALEEEIVNLETALAERKEATELLYLKNNAQAKQQLASSSAETSIDESKKPKRMADRF